MREQVIQILIKQKRQKNACRTWLVLSAFHTRLNTIEQKLKDHRESMAALAREEARKRKLEEEAAKAAPTEPDEQEAEEEKAAAVEEAP